MTGSDGLSDGTVVQPGIPLADLDWGVANRRQPAATRRPTRHRTPLPRTPRLISGPSGPTNDSTPSFAFTGTDEVTTTGQLQYSTRLDQGEWSAYSPDTSVTLAVSRRTAHLLGAGAR